VLLQILVTADIIKSEFDWKLFRGKRAKFPSTNK